MKLGFIGIGKIASSVIKGLCTSALKDAVIYLSPRNSEKAAALEKQFDNVSRMDGNQQVVDSADMVFIAVPPSQAEQILSELNFRPNHIVVSFVSFLSSDKLKQLVGPASEICRAVPLPAVERHACPILVFKPHPLVVGVLENIGTTFEIKEESQLQVLWSLTGLIAPFYDLSNKLSNWAESHGVDPLIAGNYLMELFTSLTSVARQNNAIDFAELIKEASTAGGMNEQALRMIGQEKANDAYVQAAEAILKRF